MPPLNASDNLEKRFTEWLATERAHVAPWTTLRPTEAKSNLPLLTVQPDDSVFASGDFSKNDTYTLRFRNVPAGTTALRLEALPDDRLPAHGPGMTYYEGPKGDFFLGEFRVKAGGQPVKLARASQTYAKIWLGGDRSSAALAIDGNPETGWGVFERFGERHVAVFHFAQPLASAGDLEVQLQFGRHYACSLGRFRLAATSDAQATASELPEEAEALLHVPEAQPTAAQRAKLREQFLLLAPELKAARAEIELLRKPPSHPN